jgi:hypothetical protein
MAMHRDGSTYEDLLKMLNQTLGTKFKVISGYEGTGTILVAMRRKEVDGGCWTWESMRTTARPMLNAKGDERLIPYLIHRRWEEPEVKNLPLIPDVLKKDPDKLAAYKTWVATCVSAPLQRAARHARATHSASA